MESKYFFIVPPVTEKGDSLPEQDHKIDHIPSSSSWECPQCTFMNSNSYANCEMCENVPVRVCISVPLPVPVLHSLSFSSPSSLSSSCPSSSYPLSSLSLLKKFAPPLAADQDQDQDQDLKIEWNTFHLPSLSLFCFNFIFFAWILLCVRSFVERSSS